MINGPWTDLGDAKDFPPGSQACVRIDGVPLVVMNVDGEHYAMENICPHAGRPLGDGERVGMTLTCPFHGYTFHIKTGRNIDYPDTETPVRTFPVRVEGGRVQVQLSPNDKDSCV